MAGQKKQVLTGDSNMEEKIVEVVAGFIASVIFVNIFGVIGMMIMSIFKGWR